MLAHESSAHRTAKRQYQARYPSWFGADLWLKR